MHTNKHNTYTLPVANVSTERLGICGIIFYRTDQLGITLYTLHNHTLLSS